MDKDPVEQMRTPSPWIERFAPAVRSGGTVLDVACGSGRHARLLVDRGHHVVAVDRDLSGVADLAADAKVTLVEADLENAPWPLPGRRFDAVVVTDYLHRPLLPVLVDSVASGGLLIYETFAVGQERIGRPRNPSFLLQTHELLDAVRPQLVVRAYEDVRDPNAFRQRVCAQRPAEDSA